MSHDWTVRWDSATRATVTCACGFYIATEIPDLDEPDDDDLDGKLEVALLEIAQDAHDRYSLW